MITPTRYKPIYSIFSIIRLHHHDNAADNDQRAYYFVPGYRFAEEGQAPDKSPRDGDRLVGVSRVERQMLDDLLPADGVDKQKQHIEPVEHDPPKGEEIAAGREL